MICVREKTKHMSHIISLYKFSFDDAGAAIIVKAQITYKNGLGLQSSLSLLSEKRGIAEIAC